ncbi:uncharacterized protein JCM6883_002483 [Sporobolomyces salmoneus]|uniref:uncharacterized protein n=1 Tax=Sporobolomyces salmoneus TaxID=183962 RepID=UPI00316E7577
MMLLRRLPPARIPSLRTRSIRCSSSSSSASQIPLVIASAPTYSRHLVIHTPHPASTWPSHLESISPLYRELGKRWSKDERFKDVGFGVSEGGNRNVDTRTEEWDKRKSKFEAPKEGETEEVYSATLYPDFVRFPQFSLSSLAKFESKFDSLPSRPIAPSSASTSAPARTHIYVCTHGSRDCKCGDLGEKLYQSILCELKRRKIGGEPSVSSSTVGKAEGEAGDGVRVSRIAHIGGHKFAANALVYNEQTGKCDWYGLLSESDVTPLLDSALSTNPSLDTTLYPNWRGRLGLSPSEIKSLYLSSSASKSSKKGQLAQQLGEQVMIKFVTYEGEELEMIGYEGESLMSVAKRGVAPSILATCGGNCECATCHVHIPPLVPSSSSSTTSDPLATTTTRQPASIPELPSTLPEMTDEEDEQLDFAIGADDDSRLACQIPVTKELGEWIEKGGRIKLPRY